MCANHEIGHVMSLVDLAGPLPGTQLWHTYVGDFSAMGNPQGRAPEYFGWERWQLGWLDDEQIVCATGSSARLSPLERSGGIKMLMVKTGPNTAVVVESRHAEGFDHALPKSGPLVYTIDTRLSTHDGAIKVYPLDDTDSTHLRAPLSPGQSITIGKVSITFAGRDAHGEAIEFTRAP